MANKTRKYNRLERQKSLLADFNEFNNISSFDELVKVIQSPYEFARMYRAANAKMMMEAIPAELPDHAKSALKHRGMIKVNYVTDVETIDGKTSTIKFYVQTLRREGVGPSSMTPTLLHILNQYSWAKAYVPALYYRSNFYSVAIHIEYKPDAVIMMQNGAMKELFEDRLKRLDMADLERVKSINEQMAGLRDELESIRVRVENRRDIETKRLLEYFEK
ncbi:MAG: hypothetical protein ACRC9Y_09990 [Aeromonas veronii]